MEKIPIGEIQPNPLNPRTIKKSEFEKLKQSIRDFPEMLEVRPLVLDDKNQVIGGNMRLKALQALGFTEVPILRANNFTPEQIKKFVLLDNANFGDWNASELAN